MSPLARPWSRLAAGLGVEIRELAGLAAIVLAGAALRFANLPVRGGWDSDQGTEMLALRTALSAGRLPTFGPEAISVASSFHHGALYYDLLLPAAWLGNGDPIWVVAEIALLSLLVIPIVWWIARTIGGATAGLTAALLAATSASLIGYATFIWNPTLVESGAALAFLGAWQAIRTRRAAWWVVAAVGAAVAAQAHVAAAIIVLPLAAAFLVDLRRGPAGRRPAIVGWGAAGAAMFVATYLPLIASELSHNFADARGMVAYFSEPSTSSSAGPLIRLLFAAIRILAWPLTSWPLVDYKPAFTIAFMVASALVIGVAWRVGATVRRKPKDPAPPSAEAPSLPPLAPTPAATLDETERLGVRLIGGWLLLLILALGLGLRAVSEVQELPTEQYHVVADPLVLVALGLIVGGLWRSLPGRGLTVTRRAAAGMCLVALVAWNAGHWPPPVSPDGGWPAAQAAATRVERDAAGSGLSVVPLFAPKGSDAYLYPLIRDNVTIVTPEDADFIVVLCDTFWTQGCGGSAEDAWLAATTPGTLTQVDRFNAAPDRILTVYKRAR
jgi:4-amino-4-deoxy-L-arabinose transferase-like glycosyltransferase